MLHALVAQVCTSIRDVYVSRIAKGYFVMVERGGKNEPRSIPRTGRNSVRGISLRSEIEFLKIINNHTGGGGRIFNFNTSFFPSPREEEAAAFPSPRHVPLERIVSRFAGIKIPAAALMTGKSRA